ncbi:VOC family protein [Devosia sp.]|uniref:VOC family protein n=1 Tax=Devosia sp. TaxID=1871048 RepID=UPI00326533ED
MQLSAIGQISRGVGDIAEAVTFFSDVVGLKHLYTFGELAFFDCDGTRLYLQQRAKPSPDESVLYFQVSDIVTAHADLLGRGASFVHPPQMIHRHADGTEEWMAFFNDPDGRPLAVMAQTRPPPDLAKL